MDGRLLLASSSDRQTVRIWDPAPASSALLKGTGWVRAVCAVTSAGRPLLASAGPDTDGADLGSGHR